MEQPRVPADAATILGRAGARAVEAPRATLAAGLAHVLDLDVMPPRVAEVVLVDEPPAAPLDDVEETDEAATPKECVGSLARSPAVRRIRLDDETVGIRHDRIDRDS